MSKNSWDIYLRRLNLNGYSQKDRQIATTQRIITDKFSNNPSYQVVTINDVSQEVQIVEESSLSKKSNKKRLLCKPNDDISVGDAIIWNNENWICTESEDTQVYIRGIIEKCNNNLKYLSSSGAIVTIPCIVSDRILMGSDENNYYILPNNSIYVTVGSNSDSTPIAVDKRFILGSNAYMVESIDNITKPGLITFKMSFNAINEEDDNVTLEIANYTTDSHSYVVSILNGTSAEITLGNCLQLELECTDNSEVVTSSSIYYYLGTGSTGIVSVTSGGMVSGATYGSGTVYAVYASVSDSISIDIVTASINNFTYDLVANIQPENEIKYNQTKNFVAYKYYSTGSEVTGSVFEFTIVLSTGVSSSNYLLTTSSDTVCTLKCLEYPNIVSLIATDQAIPENTITQVISLKGLI